MSGDLNAIGILTRREIEARIVAPFIRALIEEVGREKAIQITEAIIQSLAKESGRELARTMGGNSIAHFVESLRFWTKDEALQIEVLKQTECAFHFNVVRCRYAEMYRALGIADFGKHLSCSRDFALVEGFNPRMRLTRTRTIMDGAECCDFRYELDKD